MLARRSLGRRAFSLGHRFVLTTRPPAAAGALVVDVLWQSAEPSLGFGHHILHREVKFLEVGTAGGGSTEPVYRDAVAIQADKTVPAEGFSVSHKLIRKIL